MNLHKDVDITQFVEQTEGLTGADLKAICMEAGMRALREDATKIKHAHFEQAFQKVQAARQNMVEQDFPQRGKMLA